MEEPTSAPLRSLAELAAWTPPRERFNCCALPLRKRPAPSASAAASPAPHPRVLVCHDMAGGYKEDRLVQGSSATSRIYSIQHWQLIDLFVYFSHERLSVPPVAWTTAAHRNGVSVLATFITEWNPGESENLMLIYGPGYNPLIPSTSFDFSPFFADRMVELAKFHGFDGWFINIEAPLPDASHAPVMARFVRYLTERMRSEVPNGLVVWYDSLTRSGRIRWQDCLNEENKMFFDASDGFFSNYTWRRGFPEASAQLAGPARQYDVFTGIDVWGRNTFGGGGFNAHKALREIVRAGTSVAIFAPAWTYEALGSDSFEQHERRLWCDAGVRVDAPAPDADGVLPTTAVDQADVGCIADFVTPRAAPSGRWFYSNFDTGFGNRLCIDGEVVATGPWSHLARQSIPPTHHSSRSMFVATLGHGREHVSRSAIAGVWSLQLDRAVESGPETPAWIGGSSLRVSASGTTTPESQAVCVFDVFDIVVEGVGLGEDVVARIRFCTQDLADMQAEVALALKHASSDRYRIVYPDKTLCTDATRTSNWTTSVFSLSQCLADLADAHGSDLALTLAVALFMPSGGLDEANIHIHIGEVFVGPPSLLTAAQPAAPLAVAFSDAFLTADRTWISASWTAQQADGLQVPLDRRDVFVDGAWRGAAFGDAFRFAIDAVPRTKPVRVNVLGYDACGILRFVAEGTVPDEML
ncbi:hypothetical protein HK105_204486 [Polyrhizophydium stewartii]|uniref:Cytosolic endo-beta-N-acetylglucosaminidase TIM barrel domain-containing protein n=1 Tax=Polyrhizophydium stewartii TaxID=2732419 RepID=A0ABR4N983_9FUNG|nr:hypothetical protein HK105_001681 [Polyrhizophydium stewartii]